MKYLEQRIEVILRELNKLLIKDSEDILIWEYKEGYYLRPDNADKEGEEFKKFDVNLDFWRGKDKHYWFKTNVKIPERFKNKTIWLKIKTQAEGGGCQNPQFLLFVDNKIIQGMDSRHEESRILENCKKDDIRIDLQAHSGYFHSDLKLYSSIYILDEKINKLFYDIKVPFLAFEWLREDSHEKMAILNHLNEAINLLDLREAYSDKFYDSVDKAIEYIKKNIYEDMGGNSDIIASCIGHTHIDVAWRWTVEQTREKTSRSFATVVKLMEEYDNYKFMSSQPILYKFLKERYPEIYENVKKLVKDKRWEAEGACYLEPDTNLTSGESLIRQFYHGMKFFKEEFDVKNEILWLPDVFGYSGNLVQIMKKCNIKYFMTTKLAWNQYNKIPNDTFIWQGIDGSEVLTHLITTTELKQNRNSYFTTYNGMLHPDAIMGAWNRYQNKNINNDVLISYGYGDGGGGPTREMLEISKRMEKGVKGIPQVKQRFSIEYFKDLEKKVSGNKRLEKWVGELYFEYHRGTLTSMGRNKRANRKAEIELMDLEFIALFSKFEYPFKKLNDMWELVLLNQFHDILPGSSIKEVYDVTKIEYENLFEDFKNLKEKYLSISNEEGITLVNTLSHNRDDYVNLKEIIGNKNGYLGENLVQNGIAYVQNLSPKSFESFSFVEKNIDENNRIRFSENIIESPYYIINFDENYNISRLYDKENDRELLKNGDIANELIMYEDKPMWHDNWDIDEYYSEKYYKINEVKKAYVLENGPLYLVFRIEREFSKSSLIQDIYIYSNKRRIDFKTTINWDDSQHLLKAHFPVNIHSNYANFDIQFGHVKRATHKNTSWDRARFEVGAHKWIDISDSNYGFSILNDCKYGHSINENDMAITLIKSGNEPYEFADRETHYITYSILAHKGDLKDSNVIEEAYSLNYPVLSCKGSREKYSLLNVDKKNIIVETVKRAFDDSGIILRIYEAHGGFTRFNLNVNKKYSNAYLCDALENEIKEIDLKEKIDINSFEFLTIKLKD